MTGRRVYRGGGGRLVLHHARGPYEEEFEQQVTAVAASDSWQQSLITFATWPPLSGDTERNRDLISGQQAEHPLAALSSPATSSDRKACPPTPAPAKRTASTSTSCAGKRTSQGSGCRSSPPPCTRSPAGTGSRTCRRSVSFSPGVPPSTGRSRPRSPGRYCATGPATARAPPTRCCPGSNPSSGTWSWRRIGACAGCSASTIRGQYAGLLLPILREGYELKESRTRFLAALLRHSAGLNLRSMMLQGFVGDPGPGVAATLLHAALSLSAPPPAPCTANRVTFYVVVGTTTATALSTSAVRPAAANASRTLCRLS